MNTTKSTQLFAKAQKFIPGGVNSPVRAFKSVGGDPLFIPKDMILKWLMPMEMNISIT